MVEKFSVGYESNHVGIEILQNKEKHTHKGGMNRTMLELKFCHKVHHFFNTHV